MKNSTIPIAPEMQIGLLNVIGDALTSVRCIITMLLGIACMATFIVISSPVVLHAQTEWKDNYLTLAVNDQTNPAIARPSNEEYTIVVWEDERDDATTGANIYAQKIDNTNGLPQWEPVDGVAVCTSLYDQVEPRAAYDSLGNVIIVWEDYRSNTGNASIFAQSLDVDDGSANWQSNGVAVCDTTAHAEQPRIAGVAEGAFITWVDWRNYTSLPDSTNRDIYLQFIESSSGGWPQGGGINWTSCGVMVPGVAEVHDETNVELARDFYWAQAADSKDKDGVMLVYESMRDISATGGDSIYVVYADRFDADGNRTWSDVRCATNDENQFYPRIVVLGRFHGAGDSVAVIAWQDEREQATDPKRYDIYGQLLDKHDGSVLGTASGVAICTATYTQQYPELSLYEQEEYLPLSVPYLARVICVYEDLRDYSTQGVDVYCTVYDGTNGNISTPGGTNGDAVCTNDDDQTQARVDNYLEDRDSYIVWTHEKDTVAGYPQSDIWYQSINLVTLQLSRTQEEGFAVTEAKGLQETPQVSGDVFVYADKRREPLTYDNTHDWNIYAETPGECVGPMDMNWRDMFAEVTTTGDAGHMRFVVDDEHNTYIVWEEPGERAGEQDVFIQKLDVDGVPRWENSGIKLNTSTYAEHPEVTISDSTGGAQVVWQQTVSRNDTIWYAKLSPTGAFTTRRRVDAGSKPVIDYTDYVYQGYQTDFNAYIGVINTSGSVTVWNWENGTGWNAVEPDDAWFPSTPEAVLIKSSLGSGEWYLAAYSNVGGSAYLTPIACQSDGTPKTSAGAPYTGDSLRGVDIERDEHGTQVVKQGCIVYCLAPTDSANLDLYSIHLNAITTATVNEPWKLVEAIDDEYARYPALCPDSLLSSVYSGFLLAWDWEFE